VAKWLDGLGCHFGRSLHPLGMNVGLGPGHIVLDGDVALPKGAQQPPLFGPCLLWPNAWMVQDTTWYRGRPRPRRHCVRWGPSCSTLTFQPTALARSPISATAELLFKCTGRRPLYVNVRLYYIVPASFIRIVSYARK